MPAATLKTRQASVYAVRLSEENGVSRAAQIAAIHATPASSRAKSPSATVPVAGQHPGRSPVWTKSARASSAARSPNAAISDPWVELTPIEPTLFEARG
jgi:hypothetical protein